MNLQELKQQESELNAALNENRKKQKEIMIAEFIKKHNINIGDLVKWSVKGKQYKGIISKIEVLFYGAGYYHATLFKADNTLGKIEKRIYSHEMPTLRVVEKNQNP